MDYSTIWRRNEYRTDQIIKSQEHTWNVTHGNDIFINTVKSSFNPQKAIGDTKWSKYEETTLILGMPGRHWYNNTSLVKNIGEVLRATHPKKWKNAFETGRISYFSGDDGRPGSQLIMEEKSPTSVDIHIIGRTWLTHSHEPTRHLDTVSLTVSDKPLEDIIAITQADIAKVLHLIHGMQKDMNNKEYSMLRYKLIARSILWLQKLYTDDDFLKKQQKNLDDLHNPRVPTEDFTTEDILGISISHYAESICDEYNTYLAIIPSQYMLLPDEIKKDFDFFVQAARDMQDKTQKIYDMRMDRVKGVDQGQTIELLENIHLNLVQRNSRFHTILQDMCKHPDVKKRLEIFGD